MVQVKKDKYVLGQSITKQIATMGEEIRLDLQLQPITPVIGATVEGIITDSTGTPLAGALVKIMDSNFEPLLHAVTNANGEYLFNNNIPASSSYTIFAIASGMKLNQGQSFSLVEGQTKTIDFTLQSDPAMQLGIIAGDLYQTGTTTPINGAVVSLYSVVNGIETLSAITYTNQYGQFVFREVTNGSYTINISALGYLPTTLSTSLGSSNQILSLQPTLSVDPNASNGTVSGIITNNLNAPINRADVILYRVNADSTLTPVAFTKTNTSGVYLFINVPQGNYKVKSNELEIVDVNIPPTYQPGPDVDKLTLAQASTVVPLSLNAATGTYSNGAALDNTNGFAGLLGSTNDGAVTVTFDAPIAGSYALAIKYITGTVARPLVITLNGTSLAAVSLPSTGGYAAANAGTYNVTVDLVAGSNTIKFHGDGTNYAPSIGTFTADMNAFSDTLNVANFTLSNQAYVNQSSGNIGGIGGPSNGFITGTFTSHLAGTYTLSVNRINFAARPLKVDINGVNVGSYTVPIATSLSSYDINVELPAGNVTVKLYNDDGVNYAPDIRSATFLQSQYLDLTEAENATLQGGATTNNGFVQNIGGNPNGSVSITKTVPYTGVYDLIISYVASAAKQGHIFVNGTDTGTTYNFTATATQDAAGVQVQVIRLSLTAGSNTIKFI